MRVAKGMNIIFVNVFVALIFFYYKNKHYINSLRYNAKSKKVDALIFVESDISYQY